MTPEEVKLSCLENNGYETPELNDKLYLHFRGFRKIENLEPYTGCKSIWLDSNGFDTITGLEKLVELRCLYLGKNLISRISGLETLSQLTILDLSNNRLTRIENLSCCPNLQTLNVSYNALTTPASIAHLQECPALNNVDITNNRLESDEAFFDVFRGIPALVALSVNGNEITKLPTFRKRLLGHIPKLGYLDRPVEEHERFYANAYAAGGAEAEAAAREEWKAMQLQKKQAEAEAQRKWQEEQRRIREQAKAEGRSLIKEFTPEEQEERRREAQAAHDAEQRLLGLGLGRLGAKVHAMESAGAKPGVDLLDAAAEALYREDERVATVNSAAAAAEEDDDEEDVPVRVVYDDITSTGEYKTASTATAAAVEETPASVPAPPAAAVAESAAAVVRPPLPPSAEDEDSFPSETEEELSLRQQRIDESFAIYKRQQEDLKKGIVSPGYVHVDTWHAAPNKENQQAHGNVAAPRAAKEDDEQDTSKRPLFWTEAMDMALAKQVQAQMFDFDAIAAELQSLATQGALNTDRLRRFPQLLTVEACRLRWAELDAQHWCELAPGVTATDTIFRINVSEEILAAGYQPSYDELMQLTASMKPKYLKAPVALPTMPSYANDSEEEKDDEDEDEDGKVRIFKVSDVTMAAAAAVSQRSLRTATATVPTTQPPGGAVAESKESPLFEMGLD